MEHQNDRMWELSATDHPNWDAVRLAVVRFNDADEELQKLLEHPDLNMPGKFYDEVAAARQDHFDVYNVFYALDSSFMAHPVVVPEDPEED